MYKILKFDISLGEEIDEEAAEEAFDKVLKLANYDNIKLFWEKIKSAGLEPIARIKTLSEVIDGFDKQENLRILELLVDEKCILRYGKDNEEGIKEILTMYFKQISMSSS